jgi:uncharacterized protein YycO
MANIRSLKKDIDFMMSLVLEDCMIVLEKYPAADKEIVMGIAQLVIFDHHALRLKVSHRLVKNHPDGVKKYLSSIVEEMYAKADNSLEQLTAFIRNENV